MRTSDAARRAGCSVQQVRKLEAAGVLLPAARTASGYRDYDDGHVADLLAYRALAEGVGPVEARLLMVERTVDQAAFLARLDAAHAALHTERRELALAREAVLAISDEPLVEVAPEDAMTIGELAEALGVRTSTLRHWESERLLAPGRDGHGARTYAPDAVRDARLVHLLRRAGYRIAPLRELLPRLVAGGWAERLAEREASITARAGALLRASALLGRMDPWPRP